MTKQIMVGDLVTRYGSDRGISPVFVVTGVFLASVGDESSVTMAPFSHRAKWPVPSADEYIVPLSILSHCSVYAARAAE